MARTGPIHWVGVLFIFAAAIMLLISTITAPVVNSLSMMQVHLTNGSSSPNVINFGTFGYCITNAGGNGADYCSPRMVGFKPADVVQAADSSANFNDAAHGTADGLSGVQVLHPVACGIAFLAFLLSLGAGVIGSLLGFIVAFIAFVLALVVMATDFTMYGILRNTVNGDNSDNTANFGTGIWTCLAAMVLLFFGSFIVLFTCCSARRQRHRDRDAAASSKPAYAGRRQGFLGRFRRN